MKKMNILLNNNKTINIEYNDTKYAIDYLDYDEWIILKNKGNGEVLFIFDGTVDFIVECDMKGKSNFIVSSYAKTSYGYYESKLKHFVDNGGPTLELVRSFNVQNTGLNDCRVSENCFLVDSDYSGGKLYNLDKISKKYDYVDHDNYISPTDRIMVSDVIRSTFDKDITDEITYMIDLDSYNVASPIISSGVQERKIPIYDQQKIKHINKADVKYLEESKGCNIEEISPFDITVYCECVKYLNSLARQKQKNKRYVKTNK